MKVFSLMKTHAVLFPFNLDKERIVYILAEGNATDKTLMHDSDVEQLAFTVFSYTKEEILHIPYDKRLFKAIEAKAKHLILRQKEIDDLENIQDHIIYLEDRTKNKE